MNWMDHERKPTNYVWPAVAGQRGFLGLLDESPRTTDTGELAPHPGMTSEDLRDFEAWTDEIEGQGPPLWPLLTMVGMVILWVAVWLVV